jgi:hypothetical protein
MVIGKPGPGRLPASQPSRAHNGFGPRPSSAPMAWFPLGNGAQQPLGVCLLNWNHADYVNIGRIPRSKGEEALQSKC